MDTNKTNLTTEEATKSEEVKEDGPKIKNKTQRINPIQLSIIALVVGLLLAATAMTVYVYRADYDQKVLRQIVNVIPYPAAVVNGSWVSYSELLSGYDGLMNFYAVQSEESGYPIPEGDEMIANLFDNMIRSQIIEDLAKERGVEVDETKVDRLMDQAVTDSGGTVEDLTELVSENYGWTLDEFRERVLTPLVLASEVQDNLLKDEELQAGQKQIAEDALAEIQSGAEFSEVAMRVSEDPSGVNGGNIGYVYPSEFGDEWGVVLLEMEEGEVSDVLEASEVYGILQVDEIVDPEAEDPQMSVSVIIVSKRTIEDVINEELANAKVTKLITI